MKKAYSSEDLERLSQRTLRYCAGLLEKGRITSKQYDEILKMRGQASGIPQQEEAPRSGCDEIDRAAPFQALSRRKKSAHPVNIPYTRLSEEVQAGLSHLAKTGLTWAMEQPVRAPEKQTPFDKTFDTVVKAYCQEHHRPSGRAQQAAAHHHKR